MATKPLTAGRASFATSGLLAGTHSISAVYGGDTNFSISLSSVVKQVVNKAATSVSVTSSANPSTYGQSVTFTATVAATAPGSGTPTGKVVFTNGSTTLGTVTLSGGKAVFKTATLGIGSHTITATYSGDGNFTASHVSRTQTVKAALMVDTATAPKGSPQLVTEGQVVSMLTAAEQRWAATGGGQVWAALSGVTVQVADLPSGMLAEAVGKTILIDPDAAGYGWFVDPTPTKDEEFTSSNQQLRAIDPRAVDRIDLLTVVEHELGHVLGLKDLSATTDDVMDGILGVGVRRDLSHQDAVDAALAC